MDPTTWICAAVAGLFILWLIAKVVSKQQTRWRLSRPISAFDSSADKLLIEGTITSARGRVVDTGEYRSIGPGDLAPDIATFWTYKVQLSDGTTEIVPGIRESVRKRRGLPNDNSVGHVAVLFLRRRVFFRQRWVRWKLQAWSHEAIRLD